MMASVKLATTRSAGKGVVIAAGGVDDVRDRIDQVMPLELVQRPDLYTLANRNSRHARLPGTTDHPAHRPLFFSKQSIIERTGVADYLGG